MVERLGKVIKIGSLQEWCGFKRCHTLPATGACAHRRLDFEENGEIVNCGDCGKQVSAVWALRLLLTLCEDEWQKIKSARTALEEDEQKAITLRAALRVQHAWRRRHLVPSCPHCHRGILPGDGFGNGAVNPDYYPSKPIEFRAESKALEAQK